MKLITKKGTTSKILRVFIQDSSKTDISGLTGLVHNSTGLTAYYIREGAAAATAITLVTATVGTYASSGFKEVDATNLPGVYELHPPNAVIASGANSVIIFLKGATNMAPIPIEIQLDDNTSKDVYDRIGAPTGASISADVADVPTVAEFNARTLPTTDYFDPTADAVANVTLVATTTTNSDMRGTDGANTVVPDVAGTLAAYDPPTRTEATADKVEILADNTLMKQTTAGTYDRDTDSLEAIRDNQSSASTVAAAVWDEDLTTHNTANTAGWFVQKIKKLADVILAMVT